MAVISSSVSFKLVLNDGRIRKNFYLFRRIAMFSTLSSLTEEVSLALCSILMLSPVLINMQTSCKTVTDFSCVACLSYTFKYIHRSQSTAKQSESFYGWENQVTEQWCDLPELTLLPQHEEKFCFSPTSWAPILMGGQWAVLGQRFSWRLYGGTIQNVICRHLVFPALQLGLKAGKTSLNLLVFFIQVLVRFCVSVLREKFGSFQEGIDSCPIWNRIICTRIVSVHVFRIH